MKFLLIVGVLALICHVRGQVKSVRGPIKSVRKPITTITMSQEREELEDSLLGPTPIEVKVSIGETAPTTALSDGYNIPLLGLGTFGTNPDVKNLRKAVEWAIRSGYRLIDTAAIYKNEDKVGEGIADAIEREMVTRDQLFVTTKLWNDKHAKDQVVPALRDSLSKLGLDYIDLYLIHSPQAEKPDGRPDSIDILDTWAGMEECKKLGLARSIGVSNFNTEQIDKIIQNGKIKPVVNQIEVHPSHTQEELVKDCQLRNITVMAYSPFGFLVTRGKHSTPAPQKDDPKLLELAKKYNKTTSQIVLRYLIDRYLIPIPKSTNTKRIEENINVFDFRLTDDEVYTINQFNSHSSVFDDDL